MAGLIWWTFWVWLWLYVYWRLRVPRGMALGAALVTGSLTAYLMVAVLFRG
jgi:hypothetical protein